jgi:hypothetical protein
MVFPNWAKSNKLRNSRVPERYSKKRLSHCFGVWPRSHTARPTADWGVRRVEDMFSEYLKRWNPAANGSLVGTTLSVDESSALVMAHITARAWIKCRTYFPSHDGHLTGGILAAEFFLRGFGHA